MTRAAQGSRRPHCRSRWQACCLRSHSCYCSDARCGPGLPPLCIRRSQAVHRRTAALRPRLDRRELLGRCRRSDARHTRRRTVHVRPRLAVRPGRTGDRSAARTVAGQPAVGPDQRAGDPADGMGCVRSVVAAGRQRHPAAVDGVLRRLRRHHGDRGADVLGVGGSGAASSLPQCATAKKYAASGSAQLTYTQAAWDSTTATGCAYCATRSTHASAARS